MTLALRRNFCKPTTNSLDSDFFHDFFSDLGLKTSHEEQSINPKIEFYEDDKRFIFLVEVPGMKKEDIALTTENGLLKIKGEKKRKMTDNSDGIFRSEISYGKFERVFKLPLNISTKELEAKLEDGILKLTLQKKEELKSREIEIK
ncbi:MAG: Hsp20/alpha crystallin family protein [Bacteriovoracaceae bacterium]|nr:Hsp20/alpha crystallin family protein [Bacteriovoracaceae bacterium]